MPPDRADDAERDRQQDDERRRVAAERDREQRVDEHEREEEAADEALKQEIMARAGDAHDADNDGDEDVLMPWSGHVYRNHNARVGLNKWLKVRPLTAAGARSAFGSRVDVVCASGCLRNWRGVRVIDGGSGYYSQRGYDAMFGLPWAGAMYDVSVAFPDGSTHDSSTDPELGLVNPMVVEPVIVVNHHPHITSVVVHPPAGWAGVGGGALQVEVGQGPLHLSHTHVLRCVLAVLRKHYTATGL